MQIEFDKKFETNLKIILEYIAKDKLSASKKFKHDLFSQIKNLPNFPYSIGNHSILMIRISEI